MKLSPLDYLCVPPSPGVKFLLEDEAVQVGGSNHSHATQVGVAALAGRLGVASLHCLQPQPLLCLIEQTRTHTSCVDRTCTTPLRMASIRTGLQSTFGRHICSTQGCHTLNSLAQTHSNSQDLYDAIARGEYPEWKLFIQTMEPSVSWSCQLLVAACVSLECRGLQEGPSRAGSQSRPAGMHQELAANPDQPACPHRFRCLPLVHRGDSFDFDPIHSSAARRLVQPHKSLTP